MHAIPCKINCMQHCSYKKNSLLRSTEFQPAYGRLHEIRALVPSGVPYLACTATVTRSIREVIQSLNMVDCEFIWKSPDRPNIFYEVHPRSDIETDLQPVLSSLKEYQKSAPQVIVYCRTLNVCADLYAHFHFELGDSSYYPAGAEQISDNRLFGMFHSNTPEHNKDVILKSLTDLNGVVRVVFATVALGMGVNLRDVNTVYHYGAPQSINDYFQESGRGGRSGGAARSVVFWKPSDCPVKKQPTSTRDAEIIAVTGGTWRMRVHAVESGYWTTSTQLVQSLVQIPVFAVVCVLRTSVFEAGVDECPLLCNGELGMCEQAIVCDITVLHTDLHVPVAIVRVLCFTVVGLRVRVTLFFSHCTSILHKLFLLCFNPILSLFFLPTPQGICVHLGIRMVLPALCDGE